jgi:hypothetical protein
MWKREYEEEGDGDSKEMNRAIVLCRLDAYI